ncbi:dipeptide/oligopeptide/nickel ABC transporter permease/ATP-binding protein [Paeniglutamicibacter sp. Y32M11]|uniref:dipeptide/oligopeptide/nickel ABC transporter permease/ATP-binding protein n=1 Tax=Paeniglutamicibacter sp. Y32M11 TaxID=2853258 RepID=UPI001C528253|nr:dipeptide/oligopeptide/nickel ABC transporter permease/ATP-binding protein [Paeniglutamicibacter sp. Y32M11]QXQ11615.1 dipeptide/oligopeptide/nickel ABC transporter permease/ATP-binding protein [Paeniglutamicibacter sp. Y32M11]
MNSRFLRWRVLSVTSRIGIVIVLSLCAVAIFAPWIAPYDPLERVTRPFAAPSLNHLLGADDVGHDLLSVLIFGARPSLLVGLIAAIAATVIGMAVGLTAGYLRGAVDTVLMRIVDVVLALPVVPLTLVIGVVAGPGLKTQIMVISIALWAPMARELRAQVLSLRERDHIQALRAMGAPHSYVLIRHVVPAMGTLVVPQLVLAVKGAVLLEASLAFLGLGDITSMSWGMMLSVANERGAFLTGAWLWWVLPPGALIGLTVLGFALAGGAVESTTGARPAQKAKEIAPTAGPAPATGMTSADISLLRTVGLTVRYGDGPEATDAATEVNLSINRAQVLGLVGESGSGKSSVAAAIVGLMSPAARIQAGKILFDGTDLLTFSAPERRSLLGERIAFVPQEAQSALNPVYRIGEQISEAILVHSNGTRLQAREHAGELLELVGLDRTKYRAYPHQLSGGQRQRVVIAIALANDPELLVADEPTSGLDVLVQQEILDLLQELRDRLGLSMLIVTHDLPVVAHLADSIAVMRSGHVLEQGSAHKVLSDPQHPYTRRLLASMPDMSDFERTLS